MNDLIAVSSDTSKDPTRTTYARLVEAFDFFNAHLFAGKLQMPQWTLRNYGRAYGYFSHDRFGTADGSKADEIALNPRHILSRPLPHVLSTIVHEMVHQAQYRFGKPSRGGYHNKQWGQMMKEVGLHPSSTGHPGGKETGQSVSHYIIPGGPFSIACAELVNTGFALSWGDVTQEKERKPDESKTKFTCPKCEWNVWGKSDTRVFCEPCTVQALSVMSAQAPEMLQPLLIPMIRAGGTKIADEDFVSHDTRVAA